MLSCCCPSLCWKVKRVGKWVESVKRTVTISFLLTNWASAVEVVETVEATVAVEDTAEDDSKALSMSNNSTSKSRNSAESKLLTSTTTSIDAVEEAAIREAVRLYCRTPSARAMKTRKSCFQCTLGSLPLLLLFALSSVRAGNCSKISISSCVERGSKGRKTARCRQCNRTSRR